MLALAGVVAAVCVGAVVLFVAAIKAVSFVQKLNHDTLHPVKVSLEDPDDLKPVQLPSVWSSASKYLSVIIPAYNEEDRLAACLDEILSYLQQRRNKQGSHFTYEVIIVDDGSKDGTARLAFDYVRQYGFDAVRVLRVLENRGKGHAVKRGMLIARGEYLLFADADGATKFSDLERLEEGLKSIQSSKGQPGGGLLGLTCGSRAHLEKAAVAKRSALRNFLMHGFHLLVLFVAGGAVRDTQCGFKLFTRQAAALLFSNLRIQRWCFDVELLYLAALFGVPVNEVAVNWTEMAGSKIKATSILLMAWEMLVIKVSYQWLCIWKVYTQAQLQHKLD